MHHQRFLNINKSAVYLQNICETLQCTYRASVRFSEIIYMFTVSFNVTFVYQQNNVFLVQCYCCNDF